MGKPSIFSREYEIKMKRRRRRIFSLIFVLVIIVGIFAFRSNLNTYITKAKDGISSIFNKKDEANENQLATSKEEGTEVIEDSNKEENITEQQPVNNPQDQEQAVEIKFGNGDTAKALYEGEGDNKQYKLVTGLQNSNTAYVSPSGKSIIATDITTQDLKLIDINGAETIVTKTQYVSKAGETFNKDDIIKRYQGYKWANDGRFIDDSHIAYLSYLPYFKTGDIDTYVWILDTSKGTHTAIWGLKGKNISFGNVTDNKLEVTVDEKKYLLMSNGSVSNL